MTPWLKRYQDGSHAAVWDEMEALGDAIASPPHRKLADAVVQETIRRAQTNVKRLFDTLPTLGYRFDAPESATPDYPLELRLDNALDYVHKQGKKYARDPWPHPALAWVEVEEIELPTRFRKGRPARANLCPPNARTRAALQSAARPLAVEAWWTTIGLVNLAGTHPLLNPNGSVETLRATLEGMPVGTGAGADFVAAIRFAFAWAGFPGWSTRPDPPERELAFLRTQLLLL